ncbi:MAG: cytidylate kinase-like family protein [Verrucomicrobiota bacterium]|jgi:cytidylate kinase
MNTTLGLDHCLSFINCQLQSPKTTRPGEAPLIKCVTVSRQSGCGAHVFAEALAAWLQSHLPQRATPWTIFDRSLVEAVLQDHHLPSRLAAFMPEDRVSQLDDIVQDLFSLHPPTETLVRQTAETILHLAELGNVIILGRGANVITARLPQVLHVRLVGSVEQRVAHMQVFDKLSKKEALKRIEREDGGRGRYLKRYFHTDIDDPLQYHLIINTDWLALPEAAALVGNLALTHSAPETASPAKGAA